MHHTRSSVLVEGEDPHADGASMQCSSVHKQGLVHASFALSLANKTNRQVCSLSLLRNQPSLVLRRQPFCKAFIQRDAFFKNIMVC